MVDRTGSSRPGIRPAARVNFEIQGCDFPAGASGAAADIELGNLTVEVQILRIIKKDCWISRSKADALDVGRAFGHSAFSFCSSVVIPLLMCLSSSYNLE